MKKTLRLHYLIASGLGSGHAAKAPGTAGTLLFLLLWILCGYLCTKFTLTEHLTVFALVAIAGFWSTQRTLKDLTQATTGSKVDPPQIVIDEWAGMALSLLGANYQSIIELICAFALFRFFDIMKPAPIRQLERYKAEWGIMLDDLAAGLYALIILILLRTCC